MYNELKQIRNKAGKNSGVYLLKQCSDSLIFIFSHAFFKLIFMYYGNQRKDKLTQLETHLLFEFYIKISSYF